MKNEIKPIKSIKTILGRELPDNIEGYGEVKPFQGAFSDVGQKSRKSVSLSTVAPQ